MAVPAGSVFMPDNVTIALLPEGFPAYGGYATLPWANMGALVWRFPNALLVSIATRSPFAGARCADAEPGTLAWDQTGNFEKAAEFLKQYTGTARPIIYTMASWATNLENYLTNHGHARSTYILWSAHYSGLHICGPKSSGGCGYSNGADGTQYATGLNDYSVFKPGVLAAHAGYPAVPGVIQLGDTGTGVKNIQAQLNKWSKVAGFGALIVDGDFGAKTYSAVRLFQTKRGQGLAVDGKVGSATEKFLKNPPGIVTRVIKAVKPVSVPKPKVPSGNPLIKPGDCDKEVAAMQYYLRNSGLEGVRGIEADGTYGTETGISLRNFQAHTGFKGKDVDGIYGPATAKKLAKYAVS